MKNQHELNKTYAGSSKKCHQIKGNKRNKHHQLKNFLILNIQNNQNIKFKRCLNDVKQFFKMAMHLKLQLT